MSVQVCSGVLGLNESRAHSTGSKRRRRQRPSHFVDSNNSSALSKRFNKYYIDPGFNFPS